MFNKLGEGFLQGRVSVAGKLSQEVEVSSGVPQGPVLEPLLFLIYVKFITSNVIGSWATNADDFKLSVCYPRNNLDDGEEGMRKQQQDLNQFTETSKCWNLKLNPAKSMEMRFGGGWMITVKSIKYLVRACSVSRCIRI